MSKQANGIAETHKGERKQITAMFMDVVGFSRIASTADAEDLQHWQDRFYEDARAIIEAHSGEVTEYLGDGIVALFGLVRADELAASKAVSAALAALKGINVGGLAGKQLRIGSRPAKWLCGQRVSQAICRGQRVW